MNPRKSSYHKVARAFHREVQQDWQDKYFKLLDKLESERAAFVRVVAGYKAENSKLRNEINKLRAAEK